MRHLPALGLALVAGVAHAGNGLNDPGFGPDSMGMGGADLALSRDTAALNINPAGLAQIRTGALDLILEPYYFNDSSHRDAFGNDTKVDNPVGTLMSGGYARRISPDLVAGVGVYVQGGVGFVYEDVATAFGTDDDMLTLFSAVKFTPGLAWQVSDRLSVGGSLGIAWSSARQKFFPGTSIAPGTAGLPPGGFQGFRVDGLAGWSGGLKLGLQYRPSKDWTIGMAYTDEIPLDLHGGDLRANFAEDPAIGRRVRYRDAKVKGLAIAGEAGVGVAWQATPRLKLATELNWLDWSHAMKKSTLTATRPDHAAAPAQFKLEQRLDWRDQWVVALGAEWLATDRTTWRVGINHGRNPIPDDALTPLLAVIGETSLMGGYAYQLTPEWAFEAAVHYQVKNSVTYTNPEAPFGPNANEHWQGIAAMLCLTRQW
ncbi:MAG TPA: outer membrane protein transport protein [Nevskiaceae bacterium]|nr:outer membrane protein transport protein [Nevskiaceae bacterium]